MNHVLESDYLQTIDRYKKKINLVKEELLKIYSEAHAITITPVESLYIGMKSPEERLVTIQEIIEKLLEHIE